MGNNSAGSRRTWAEGRAFWGAVDPDDDVYQEFIRLLCAAYRSGYSVLELSRVLDQNCKRKVYELLRDAGAIPRIRRGRRRSPALPVMLIKTLEKAKISYASWANSHGLCPERTEAALSCALDRTDPISVAAHNALRNDWPGLYGRMFDPANTPSYNRSPGKEPGGENHDKISIEFDFKKRCFTGYIDMFPHIRGDGETRERALATLKMQYVLHRSIKKLQNLPPHPDPVFTVQEGSFR